MAFGSKHGAFVDKMKEKMKKQQDGDLGSTVRPGMKADGTKKKLVPRIADKLKFHADNKTLTRKARGAVGLNPTPNSGFETKKHAQGRAQQRGVSAGIDLGKPATPESSAGHDVFLEKYAPKMAEKMMGASAQERAGVARKMIETQMQSDPDSLFHHFGAEEMKNQIRKNIDFLRTQ